MKNKIITLISIYKLVNKLTDKYKNDVYGNIRIEPFKHQPHKMVKHTKTIHRQQPTNILSVFDHFVGFALKGLMIE